MQGECHALARGPMMGMNGRSPGEPSTSGIRHGSIAPKAGATWTHGGHIDPFGLWIYRAGERPRVAVTVHQLRAPMSQARSDVSRTPSSSLAQAW